ncbi:MAG TPA: antitoxin [Ignavibacteria bacterium]|nr:antitoxin [Ignavibacteria bacterium]
MLNKEEKELLKSVEKGEWKSIKRKTGSIKRYKAAAKATFNKDRRINIRISQKDLNDLRKKAIEEGLPYQTLISSLLHKFITGKLVSK